MKAASWNVNSLRVRLPQVLRWLETSATDILALQETKLHDDDFPQNEIQAAGYSAVYSGQKTYNGVALLSRTPATEVVTQIPDVDNTQKRILAATINNIRVINLYVVNGESVDSEKFAFKLDWLAGVTKFIAAQLRHYERVIVMGDFNIAPTDADVHDPALWHDRLLCSVPERRALQKLLTSGLVDSFRLFDQAADTFSWWDYRDGGFRRNIGLRIDLILISHALVDACSDSTVDKQPRGWERPSDHCPAVIEFDTITTSAIS